MSELWRKIVNVSDLHSAIIESIYNIDFSYLIHLFHYTLIAPLLITCRAENVTIIPTYPLKHYSSCAKLNTKKIFEKRFHSF